MWDSILLNGTLAGSVLALLSEKCKTLVDYPFGAGIIFLILAHPVYKLWLIQEPNKLALWNKLHFEEKKTESIVHV